MMSPEVRQRFFTPKNGMPPGAILVDGFVAGCWSLEERRGRATLRIETLAPLAPRDRDEVHAEGNGSSSSPRRRGASWRCRSRSRRELDAELAAGRGLTNRAGVQSGEADGTAGSLDSGTGATGSAAGRVRARDHGFAVSTRRC